MPSFPAVTIAPARRLRGRLRVPGDKSISHRYAILAALADGRSTLANYAPGADCRSTLAVLRRLGVEGVEGPAGMVTVLGRGFGRLRSPSEPLDAGNSGTTMRLMAGVLAGHPFSSTMVGDASLSRRPMRRVIAPLEQMGARIESVDGHAPLTIRGSGLHADGTTTVKEPAATRDHTERAVRAFGGQVAVDGPTITIGSGQHLTAQP